MRAKVEKKTETKKTDYNFLLKCMAALTTAALLTAGAVAIVAAKSGAASAGAASLLAASAVAGPIGALAAMIGLVTLIAAACILPCLFGGRGNSVAYVSNTPYYRPWSWWSTPVVTVPAAPIHVRSGSIFDNGGTIHTRSGGVFGGTTHTRSDGVFGNGGTTHTRSGGVFGGGYSGSLFGANNSHSHAAPSAQVQAGPTMHRR